MKLGGYRRGNFACKGLQKKNNENSQIVVDTFEVVHQESEESPTIFDVIYLFRRCSFQKKKTKQFST